MSLYKKKRKLKTLLAMCFSMESETYHHWRVFSDGSSGVCVSFKRLDYLMDILSSDKEIRSDDVQYLKIRDLKALSADVTVMPFLKRAPFRPEREFRIIFESKTEKLDRNPTEYHWNALIGFI